MDEARGGDDLVMGRLEVVSLFGCCEKTEEEDGGPTG